MARRTTVHVYEQETGFLHNGANSWMLLGPEDVHGQRPAARPSVLTLNSRTNRDGAQRRSSLPIDKISLGIFTQLCSMSN